MQQKEDLTLEEGLELVYEKEDKKEKEKGILDYVNPIAETID